MAPLSPREPWSITKSMTSNLWVFELIANMQQDPDVNQRAVLDLFIIIQLI